MSDDALMAHVVITSQDSLCDVTSANNLLHCSVALQYINKKNEVEMRKRSQMSSYCLCQDEFHLILSPSC